MPFGLNSRMQSAWWTAGQGGELANQFLARSKIFAIPAGNTGCQMGGWFRKEIKEPADLNGLKFRVAGFAGRILQKLGVVPQQLAGGDIYPALEKGTLDATEWVGPYDDEKLGFQKVAQYYYYPGWWEGGAMLHNFINLEKWNELPKSYQAIVRSASAEAHEWMLAKYDAGNPAALRRLVGSGAQLRPFSPAVLEACYKASSEVYAEISGSNADFKKIMDSISAFRADGYLWWQVAEYTFDTFMIRARARG
jgi:TRAP-type mannitol/chloroaromatic compound transport system substrate-binding protein